MSPTLRFRWVCRGPGDCEGCAALNGEVRALDEWNIFPGFHPNCDCTLEPVVEQIINNRFQMLPICVQFIYPVWHIGKLALDLYWSRRCFAPTQAITSLNNAIVFSIKALNPTLFPIEGESVLIPPNVKPPSLNPPTPYVASSLKRFG